MLYLRLRLSLSPLGDFFYLVVLMPEVTVDLIGLNVTVDLIVLVRGNLLRWQQICNDLFLQLWRDH
jgi:hypothetical protein